MQQQPFTCPWCQAPTSPSHAVQTCTACRGKFTLSAGPAVDGAVVPPPFHPNLPVLSLKWSIIVSYRFAHLTPPGIESGTLDPVIAVAPVDQQAIAYPDVASIAVWRRIAWTDLVVALLVPVPLALVFFSIGIAALSHTRAWGLFGVMLALGSVFGILAWYLVRRGAIIGRRQMRIIGRFASFTVPFEQNDAFCAEMFRRSGMVRPPIP